MPRISGRCADHFLRSTFWGHDARPGMTHRRGNPAFLLMLLWICLWFTTNTAWVFGGLRVTAPRGRCNLSTKAKQHGTEGSPERVNPLSEDVEELRSQASKLRSMALSQRERAAGLRDRAEALRDRAAVLRDQADQFRQQGEWDQARELVAEADKVVAEAKDLVAEAKDLVAEARDLEDQAEKLEDWAKELSANEVPQVFDLENPDDENSFLDKMNMTFGLCKNRWTQPAPLATEFFFDQLVQRQAALCDLLEKWYKAHTSQDDRSKLPIIALPAAPGTGKSRFAQVVAARGSAEDSTGEWCKAMSNSETTYWQDDQFKKNIQQAVAITVTFNFNTQLLPEEVDRQYVVGVRMLHSFFCRDTDYETFRKWLETCNCHRIKPMQALKLIRLDMAKNGFGDSAIILIVDEPLMSVQGVPAAERPKHLGHMCTSIGHLITNHKDVYVMVTSLSFNDLVKGCTPSGRPVTFVSNFDQLSGPSVSTLMKAQPPGVQARLRGKHFKSVLSSCLGLPRLVVSTFQAAMSKEPLHGANVHEILGTVKGFFNPVSKYTDAMLRQDALFAAFNSLRCNTVAREARTLEAEAAGYLFKPTTGSVVMQIPPVLLLWWNDYSTLDDTTPLLQAASQIISLATTMEGVHDKYWEYQVAHLYRLLSVSDKLWRAEQGPKVRTLSGLFGHRSMATPLMIVHPESEEDDRSTFNYPLQELPETAFNSEFVELEKAAVGRTDLPPHLFWGRTYFPKDIQNPGFDFAVIEQIANNSPEGAPRGQLLVLVEAKFSGQESSTELRKGEVLKKFLLTLEGRPVVQKAFAEGRLCCIVASYRKLQQGVERNISDLINNIAESIEVMKCASSELEELHDKKEEIRLLVRRSLIILSRDHLTKLLSPTLASLPPLQSCQEI